MHLKKITLRNFRNISDASLEFSPRINCILGNNGAGKTNLLDAVYYLSMTKSFFSSSDRFVCGYGTDETLLSGEYIMDDLCLERISASIKQEGKIFRRGAKPYGRFSDHIGLLPVVMVSPSDSALVNDSGEERRKYMNSILSQTDRLYLTHIQAYNQLLSQRNHLLKNDSPSSVLLDTFDERMAPHAEYVHSSRRMLCEKLEPIVSQYYAVISGEAEKVSLEYRSDIDGKNFIEILFADRQKDMILKYTSRGIQRDDLLFRMDSHSLRRCGSQGQQKTFLLSMKLAQMDFMKQSYGRTPILLLDDVFDKLDMERVESLISMVARSGFGQIFITDSSKERISPIVEQFSADCVRFTVDKGVFSML